MTHAPNRALLLMDYQVALCEEGPHLRMPPLAAQVTERGVLATAEKVLSAARTAGWLVVHVRLAFDPTYALRTNRLPRFDAYPDQKAMLADSPEAQIVAPTSPRAVGVLAAAVTRSVRVQNQGADAEPREQTRLHRHHRATAIQLFAE